MVKEYDVKKLKELVDSKDVESIKLFMKENNLVLKDGIIESIDKAEFDKKVSFYDMKQYVTKIKSNSAYGCILNPSSTFYKFELGSSITLSGRKVWQHLASKSNEILTDDYNYEGECVQTGDTDSSYMCLDKEGFRKKYPNFDYSRDNLVKFADKLGNDVNATFPQYMIDTFHCTEKKSKIEEASREVVASRGLICGKKRYALMVFDKDGYRVDTHGKPGKIKIMGIQVSRSDTPQIVRELLKKMLESLLTYGSKDKLMEIMKDFAKNKWNKLNAWEKGTPKTCNKLSYYENEYKKTGKCSVGQVMGAINWNHLIEINNDKKTPKVLDGDKVIVIKLKQNNSLGMTSISIPLELERKPKWFKDLPFDEQSMENSVIDKTLETVFGVLDWKLTLSEAMNYGENVLDDILTFE